MNGILTSYMDQQTLSVLVPFMIVLLASLGIPVPAMLTLILVGSSLAQADSSVLAVSFASALAGAMVGDIVWYWIGARYGERVLSRLRRLTRRPATGRQGLQGNGLYILLFARFIPGLSAVAVPMAGASSVSTLSFVRYDALGSGIWVGFGLLSGVTFSDQVDNLVHVIKEAGMIIGVVVATFAALVVIARQLRGTGQRSQQVIQAVAADAVEPSFSTDDISVVPALAESQSAVTALPDNVIPFRRQPCKKVADDGRCLDDMHDFSRCCGA
ncbi:DedA family protein [Pokkaliibacter sp. MBI-7]|uniref:DedA family protein n=1 Tax=Pokkaliibacter sp. MBI-7 TaxID=3040600 RepID=UPI00244CE6F5|nr:DedA family protein [Pokkaliibacter sp. MBI-7]MDH2435046.1 DedA family protein [Pokkaliibacter sp. MBI-7]